MEQSSDLPTVECSICGRDGEPPAACDACHGGAATRPRSYYLSDIHSGKVKDRDRYGNDGGLEPRDSPLVVGGLVR
jgi:hypothetical protein